MSTFQYLSFDKVSEDGVITIPNTADFRHFIIAVHADVSTTATIKVQGSAQEAAPDFGEASASDNDWAYIAIRDLGTANLIAGATGISISATTHHKLYEVEANGLTHLGIELSSVSGDGVAFKVFPRND